MSAKDLDKLAELLLDVGKRNNSINFRNTTSTVEIIYPGAVSMLEKVSNSILLEVYEPEENKYVEKDQSDSYVSDKGLSKSEYFDLHSPQLKKENQVLLYHPSIKPFTALKNINKKAKSVTEETGVNVVYIAFGFIHWKESENSDYFFQAPILLAPVTFTNSSATEPYFINISDDEIIVNPTFNFKLINEYGISLPEYDGMPLNEYINKISEIVGKLNWTVSDECKIGIFSFLKINMYHDLKENAESILENNNVRMLLGETFEQNNNMNFEIIESDTSNSLIDLHSIVDADSSQIKAIEMAKSGSSFVLQGPPGTGKSQTITNIIAECLNDGKKILFVSEKLAALNVVHEKLKQAGLSEFCLELHSYKANKKNIVKELCDTLHLDKRTLSSKATQEIIIKEKAQKQLDNYAKELHKPRAIINKTLYQLYEEYSSCRNTPDIEFYLPDIESKGEEYLTEAIELLEQYVSYIPSVGYNYKNHSWYGYYNQDNSYRSKEITKSDLQIIEKMLTDLTPAITRMKEKYGVSCENINAMYFCNEFFDWLKDANAITPGLFGKNKFEYTMKNAEKLQVISEDILTLKENIEEIFNKNIYEINGQDYYRKLTKQFNKAFLNIFNGEYRQLLRQLHLCKKDGQKVKYKDAVLFMNKLALYQQKLNEYIEIEKLVKSDLGPAYVGICSDWVGIMEQFDHLESLHKSNTEFGNLSNFSSNDFEKEKSNFSSLSDLLKQCFHSNIEIINRLALNFETRIFDVKTSKIDDFLKKCRNCLKDIDEMDNWFRFRALLSQLNDGNMILFIEYLIEHNVEAKHIVNTYRKMFYRQWIGCVVDSTPILSNFTRISQDQAVRTFSEKDKLQFEINKAQIKAKLSAKRPSLDIISPGSAISLLLREANKKKNLKSIRTLLSETGELVQILKPCFLMSPLSVSTFLSSSSVRFDVVIFDEASQIFPHDAIGAIYRGKQLIVAGDSKQMPPSNFFSATVETNYSEDEETEDITDFESVLDLCSTTLPQLYLKWHYRSRYEQLISFSNKNFYDNNLITFPSSQPDKPGIGVDYCYVDGTFDHHTHANFKEAEYIVDLIYKNIEEYPERSLGVVAFSSSQQNLIEELLYKRRKQNSSKEFFFDLDKKEPFFIKNLETVQGDERDTIIFSIAYAKDSQGRLIHNFGPLNRVGGERRLNVAITRAKYNIQVVTSMHNTDIDLKRTQAEGSKLLREYLDFAENGTIALERALDVKPFEQLDSEFEMEVYDFLKSKGFSVDTQVGCSNFRIDLGLKLPNSSDYVLAIECDGATYHSSKNARDRDRLRQEILKNMGWKFYRIWSTDWFKNNKVEKEKLLEVASKVISTPSTNAYNKPYESNENFEEIVSYKHFEFPKYTVVDIPQISKNFGDLQGLIKAVLQIEAPLSEEWLLKRILYLFNREKITSLVRGGYEKLMYGCQKNGIIRKNGFLYLQEQNHILFRAQGDIPRDFKYVSPEELASGMLELIKQNISVSKDGLYKSIAGQLGVSRMGDSVYEKLESSLRLLNDKIIFTEDNRISLKH